MLLRILGAFAPSLRQSGTHIWTRVLADSRKLSHMYKLLQSRYLPNEVVADLNPPNNFTASWIRGVRLQPPPPDPLVLTWDADHEGGRRLPYYSAGTVVMHRDLVKALQAAGVDNLDNYPCVIESTQGHPDCLDYLAVNILGVVDAIDRDNSVILGDDPEDLFFESLAIDGRRAHDLELFRLKDAENLVVIHDRVVKRLQAQPEPLFAELVFLDPQEYAG